MDVDIQIQDDGSIVFVTPEQGEIARLSRTQLAMLQTFSWERGTPPISELLLAECLHIALSTGAAVARRPLNVPPVLVAEAMGLRKLGLVVTAGDPDSLEALRMVPRRPLKLTAQGRRLYTWLHLSWPEWPAYSERFPLS